ncbi:MAG: radical SAM protein [Phycisphaerae bacterium]|nr:radical SAM protein [Phycisphaerae bacterium]
MQTLGMTQSTCEICRRIVPAKVVADGSEVCFEKFCSSHGVSRSRVHGDLAVYLRTQRYVKPAWTPLLFSGESDKPCPEGCGFCSRHEQHLCMPIVEITSRCDLACPVCITDAGREWDITLDAFDGLLRQLIRAEKQIDVLNLSGGEPLLHPQLLSIIDAALLHPEIIRVSISTNGLSLLDNPALARALCDRNIVVALQFDGFDERAYEILRGRKLLDAKLAILGQLSEVGVATSLTFTAAGGVNTDQLSQTVDYLFANPHVLSLMIQPLAFAGRASKLSGRIEKLTVAKVVELLDGAGDGRVKAADFAPLPCSHPLCFGLAFYLMFDDGRAASLNGLVDASTMLDALANRTIFGLDSDEHDRLKDLVYAMWSGPAASTPDSEAVMKTLRSILDELSGSEFDARYAFGVAERHIKSVFIHAFQGADDLDLSRVRRCCQAYPQPDGKLIPACVHNVLRRKATAQR